MPDRALSSSSSYSHAILCSDPVRLHKLNIVRNAKYLNGRHPGRAWIKVRGAVDTIDGALSSELIAQCGVRGIVLLGMLSLG